MIDITLQNFETDLIGASMHQPVLLDIWAPWCGPCRTLGPVLEKLEVAYAGRFKLAKLNSDEQPEIAGQLGQAFGVRSIPFCVLFMGGQPVDGFVGALPESEVRKFLDRYVPPAGEEDEEPLDEESAADDAGPMLDKLKAALDANPNDDGARYEYLRALLAAGRAAEARRVFEPVAPQAAGKTPLDVRFAAVGHWLSAIDRAATARSPEALATAIAANKRDFDARFELAQVHFAAQRFTQAMDELLEIVMRDKAWNDELARRTFVAILELMTKAAPKAAAPAKAAGSLEVTGKSTVASADPVVDQYRRKLSMALF